MPSLLAFWFSVRKSPPCPPPILPITLCLQKARCLITIRPSIRLRAFFKQRVIGRIGGGHGGELRTENENASNEGMKSSHKELLIYQKMSNAQRPTSNVERGGTSFRSSWTCRSMSLRFQSARQSLALPSN